MRPGAGRADSRGQKCSSCKAGGYRKRALQQKTGYAETPRSPPSITRGFGLTRAQPNPRPFLRAGTRQTNCRRENSVQLVKILLLVVRALEASRHPSRRGGKGLQARIAPARI